MNYDTFRRYDHTADLYDYRLVPNSGAGNAQEFFFDRTIKCNITSDTSGRLFLYVPDKIKMNVRLTNIRDKEGNLVAEASGNDFGWSYDVTSVIAQVSAFGYRTGMRYTLTRT